MRKGFDWLRHSSGTKKPDSGISVLDLSKLPPVQRRIMRIMLRQREMTYTELLETVKSMPADERIGQDELDEVLKELVKQEWLLQACDQEVIYKINLRHKSRRKLNKSIWDALDTKTEHDKRKGGSDTDNSK